jgi:cysteine desulfurase
MKNMAYFDNSATSNVDPRVLEEMVPFFLEKYGNPSSLHSLGRGAEEGMIAARGRVSKAINSAPEEVIFTSGGTESDNMALQGYAYANRSRGNHIITTRIEHHAILNTCEFLQREGFKITYLPVDEFGLVDLEKLKDAMTRETLMVSVMTANNEIGTIEPVKAIAEIAHEKGAVFHTDAVQSITKVQTDVVNDHIDMLSMSGHKFHAPKGIGALYLKKGVKIRPIVYGGGQERGLRSSTENVPGIVGMGKAIELGMAEFERDVSKMTRMRDRLIDGVLSEIPDTHLNGHRTIRLCNNAHFRFDGVEGESLLIYLDQQGFCVSTGSACSARTTGPSQVLSALGLRNEQMHGSVRASLSKFNTMEEIERFLEVAPGVVKKLREMSPIYKAKEC